MYEMSPGRVLDDVELCFRGMGISELDEAITT